MTIEASWYEALDGDRTHCLLCPRDCRRGEGQPGACLGRVTRGGKLWAETYAKPVSAGMDPIEKKPLYHFHPGGAILSLGTYGCNLTCGHCQNFTLSQQENPTQELPPEEAPRVAREQNSIGVAYTYNEPFIWAEYVRDAGRAVREAGLKNVLVTNGWVNPGPLEDLLPVIDAMNIDIKAFTEEFYREVCGATLAPVLETARRAARACHVEVTNLVIPGHNDDPAEQDELAGWIAAELGGRTPVHLSAYRPVHKLQARPTTPDDLLAARERFRKHLAFVYLGNVRTADGGITTCPSCGAEVVNREGYRTDTKGLADDGTCAACGADCGFVR